MLFHSVHFLLFFPVVLFLYYSTPAKRRWALLLGASYYFYMCWKPTYALLILGSTLVDYFAALGISNQTRETRRKALLVLSLSVNLGILVCFKYFNFLSTSLEGILSWWGTPFDLPSLNVLLPIGISFYTFQSLAYTIDVYRRKIPVERHFGYFALYVSYFPQLVAGPIERASNLIPQLRTEHRFNESQVVSGIRRILWGLFKKLVIADRVALIVDATYLNPSGHHGLDLLIATYAFAIQIYFDFSAYSDMAIGASQALGVKLMENFKAPYLARSIPEFWHRWHISLSTWFRDYLYLPLGGNRNSWARNITIVFLLSGLWHGANWTFVCWGLWHALLFLVARNNKLRFNSFAGALFERFVTFHFVCIGWVFFRANSVSDAFVILQRIGDWLISPVSQLAFHPTGANILMILLAGTFMLGSDLVQEKWQPSRIWEKVPTWVRWPVYGAATFLILNLGVVREIPFLYFQF